MERYTTEQQVNHVVMIANGVARELSDEVTLKASENDLPSDARRRLQSRNGYTIIITFVPHKNQLHISSVMPANRYLPQELRDEVRSIYVSVNKSPEAVAKEIKRRLIPGSDKVAAYIMQAEKEEKDYLSAKQANAKRLLETLGEVFTDSMASREVVSSYGSGSPYVSIQPSRNDVKLEVSSCPIGLADTICRVIAEYRKAHPKK